MGYLAGFSARPSVGWAWEGLAARGCHAVPPGQAGLFWGQAPRTHPTAGVQII